MQSTSRVLLSRFTMEVATALVTSVLGAIVCYGSLEFGVGWGDDRHVRQRAIDSQVLNREVSRPKRRIH